jgi:dethiobiotin synthetase
MKGFVFPNQFFIAGTDTNVGKTVVSALLTIGLRATYWKPIQSGLDAMTDTDSIRIATGLDDTFLLPERFRLTQPLSPHAAAAIDGVEIHLTDFKLPRSLFTQHLIVEGAGGLMVPLNSQDLMIDLIKFLELPVCLVARTSLGTINHSLLSIAQLRQSDIPILGVILNGKPNAINREAIAHYGKVSILGELDYLDHINPVTLKNTFDRIFTP